MIEVAIIDYAGAQLEVPTFLVDLWPHDLKIGKWPTFCGAGDGMGDKLVPDTIYLFAKVAPACFVHDIEWAICQDTDEDFEASNDRLKRNLIALVEAQLFFPITYFARQRCHKYWIAVMIVGKLFFKVDPRDLIVTDDPLDHPVVREKIHRLARVAYGIHGYDSNGGKI